MRRLALPLTLGLCLTACDLFDVIRQRLAVLGVDFSFARLDVAGLVYPQAFSQIFLDLAGGNRNSLKNYGVDIHCEIAASNPNAQTAHFDGAVGHLRVLDTAAGAPSAQAAIPRFSVAGGSSSMITLVFPLRLSNPIFTRSAWSRIINGEEIPYRIDADMVFNVAIPDGMGGSDTLVTKNIQLNVVTSKVNAKTASQSLLENFLRLIEIAL
jgi:hypothetical protein